MRLRPGNLEEVAPASFRGLHLLKRWDGEAAVLYEQGHTEEARLLLERGLAVDPQHLETLVSLGSLHLQQGRLEEAQPLIEQALEVEPRDADSWCNLGAVHVKQGRLEEARRCCERALAVDPESRIVQYLLDKLGGGIAAGSAVAAPPALEIGAVVRVGGLAQRPELNGAHGTVRSFDAEAGR